MDEAAPDGLAAPAVDGLPVADEGTSAAGTWLELAIEADPEAVEAVSEILSRVAAGGVSVEQPFATEQEGLAAVPIEGAPATVRAYLPALDRAAAEAAIAETRDATRPPDRLRPAAHRRAARQRRPRGGLGRGLEGALPGHAPRPAHRHPADLARATTPAPDDVVVALDPGMAFGTGLHPTTRLCLVGLERWREAGLVTGASVIDVGCGLGHPGRGGRPAGRRALRGVDTDPIAVEATRENAAPQRA